MITTKKIRKHIKEEVVIDKTFCDICKKEIKNGSWEQTEIRIEAIIGYIYPEVDTRTGCRIDCCKECWLNKIRPLIEKEFGVSFFEFDNEDDEINQHSLMKNN